ncbi:MAG: heat shock protein transcriptional repressor HspR [Acidimicrobiales bacterium]
MDLRGRHRAVYIISVAAELAGVHPQTLRIYERKGLVDPARTGGGSRRYSDADIDRLRKIQELTNEGLNLAGVKRVLALEARVAELEAQLAELVQETALVPLNQDVVIYRESRKHRG